ncbi:MAG: hypothetical protein [Microvirus sp.]|nr:MAG: hypothetical protein [Microvirus sp.]
MYHKTITQTNFKPSEIHPEVNLQPSMTIPDQNMSIREILHRYTSGMPISDLAWANPQYDLEADEEDGEFIPEPHTLDLTEREAIRDEIQAKLGKYSKNTGEADKQPKSAVKHPKSPEGDQA